MGIDAGYEWLLGLKLPFQCIDAQGTVSEPYCARRGRTIRFSGEPLPRAARRTQAFAVVMGMLCRRGWSNGAQET